MTDDATNTKAGGSPLLSEELGVCFPERAEWEYLKPYGYAPGHYMNKCHHCERVVDGVDKRAITCRPCAEALHERRGKWWERPCDRGQCPGPASPDCCHPQHPDAWMELDA